MRNYIKYWAIGGLALLSTCNIHSQDINALTIGNIVPDLRIKNIVNYITTEISLSELKGKAILLDFGSTGCIPCIKSLPTLDSIQNKMNDLQIFFVIKQKKEAALAFLSKHKDIKIPIITEDTLLSTLFRHYSVPHEVWIDKNKRVKAFTDAHYLYEENFNTLVKGGPLNLPVKWDFAYDYQKAITILNSSNLSPLSYPTQIFYQCFISKRLDGVMQNFKEIQDSLNNTVRISMINQPIENLYRFLYEKPKYRTFPASHIILALKDSSKIFYDTSFGYKADWEKNNTFCYEAIFPSSFSAQQRSKRIWQDLECFFNLKVKIENRKIPCWIVINKGGERFSKIKPKKEYLSLQNLLRENNKIFKHPPVIDETNLSEKIRNLPLLEIDPNSFHDVLIFRKKLAAYGLDILEEEREIQVCVFADSSIN